MLVCRQETHLTKASILFLNLIGSRAQAFVGLCKSIISNAWTAIQMRGIREPNLCRKNKTKHGDNKIWEGKKKKKME